MRKHNQHCCSFMHEFIKDFRVGVYYDPTIRFYSLFIPPTGSFQGISHCPWCGKKLPSSLIDEYEQILKEEYNIDNPYDEQEKNVPQEFKTDLWWKRRNL